jgi:hypothetical protein
MKKRDKIIYWIFTIWHVLGMFSTGIVQLNKMKDEVDMITHCSLFSCCQWRWCQRTFWTSFVINSYWDNVVFQTCR